MQVVRNLKENKSHNITEAGAYEWWYFDGIDDKEEYSFNVMILTGNPFSPEYNNKVKDHFNTSGNKKPDPMDFCALSFNLYYKGRPVYCILYEYEKNQFLNMTERGMEKIFLEKNNFYFHKDEGKYYLNINLSTADINNKFKAEFIFTPKVELSFLNGKDNISVNGEKHFWLPAASVCELEGKFKFYRNFKRTKTEITGFGYHDHNWGNEAMFLKIKNWCWGRYISNEYSLVYFNILYNDEKKKPLNILYVFREGKLIYEINESDPDVVNKKGWFGGLSKDFSLNTKDIKFRCSNKTKIDNGLFYNRFISNFNLDIKDKNVLNDVVGISANITPGSRSGLLNFRNSRAKKIE